MCECGWLVARVELTRTVLSDKKVDTKLYSVLTNNGKYQTPFKHSDLNHLFSNCNNMNKSAIKTFT